MTRARLDERFAESFAAIALANVAREYPNKPDHVLGEPGDARTARSLHPVFYGSYDWHSCVHTHWLLAYLWRRCPGLRERDAIAATFDAHLTADAIAAECAYLARPDARAFERTYGWAWLLKLADELHRCDDARVRRWSQALAPLVDAFVDRYRTYLPKATYPIRYGTHPNSAFGVAFALDYARTAGIADLEALCVTKAREWFAGDRDAPAAWEPSGADFLSPSLIEADLMRRVLDTNAFAAWLERLLPGLAERKPATLFAPPIVSDRLDPQIVHLDGLALSRAWCFRGIAAALPRGDPRIAIASQAADVHVAAGLVGMQHADYLGTHWLASFAALALAEPAND
jgi:Protein of unknown function (DUF2891)